MIDNLRLTNENQGRIRLTLDKNIINCTPNHQDQLSTHLLAVMREA